MELVDMVGDAIPIHPVYLPFSREQLRPHFSQEKHLDYFTSSAIRYSEFVSRFAASLSGMPITGEVRYHRQLEKDERFWTTCTLKSIFDTGQFASVLRMAFGEAPPIPCFSSWEEGVGDASDQTLSFEVAVPSPVAYRESLRARYKAAPGSAHIVPYVVDAGVGRTAYEGATKVDAVFSNRKTGLHVSFEAKVLSDISCDVTFDPFRNQIARNIDIMLNDDEGAAQAPDISKRLLVLLTPQAFKDKPSTRYYGLLFHEYKRNPSFLAEHLAHRDPGTLHKVPSHLGWLTFEECLAVCPTCCPWLAVKEAAAPGS